MDADKQDRELKIVMIYTGWSEDISKAALKQWHELDTAWSCEYITEYFGGHDELKKL